MLDQYDFFDGMVTHVEDTEELKPHNFQPDALFGAFCLFALNLKLSSQRIPDRFFKSLKASSLVLVARLASARSAPMKPVKLAKLVGRCGLSGAQGEFIRRWNDGEVTLTDVGMAVQLELVPDTLLEPDEITREDLDSSA